jgi:hypothetical protein
MEVCEQSEAFIEVEGDLSFSHTKVILRDGHQYYYVVTSHRYLRESQIDLAELNPMAIPTSKIWPPFPRPLVQYLNP